MSFYESFLKEAVETLQLVKDELKNDPVSNLATVGDSLQRVVRRFQTFKSIPISSATAAASAGTDKLSDGVWLYSYIAWIRLTKMIERNLAMIDNGKQQIFKTAANETEKTGGTSTKKSTKAPDVVRMYDLLLQVRDCFNLSCVAETDSSQFLNDTLAIPALNTDKTIQSDVAFQTTVYKACRFDQQLGHYAECSNGIPFDIAERSTLPFRSFNRNATKIRLH